MGPRSGTKINGSKVRGASTGFSGKPAGRPADNE